MDIIDVRGKPCPIPVIEAKKVLRNATAGTCVRVLVDNDISRQNLEKMAQGMGHGFAFEPAQEGAILVTITVSGTAAAQRTAGPGLCTETGVVIAIGKNTMGIGNDELGAILIKGFIYSLTELDTPPETILFFNSGVYLSTEGSAVLADLKTLEGKGTIIASCGTCLDFYKLKEKLAVGSVTNMYAITTAMAGAEKLINF